MGLSNLTYERTVTVYPLFGVVTLMQRPGDGFTFLKGYFPQDQITAHHPAGQDLISRRFVDETKA